MIEKATFAMGCFWQSQSVFDKIPGVISTRVGYVGGCNPGTYDNAEKEGHAEVVEITYNSNRDVPISQPQAFGHKISYEKLLKIFWKSHDPTTLNKQGNDIGKRYRSAIFYHNQIQKKKAEKSLIDEQKKIGKVKGFGPAGLRKRKIVTHIVPVGKFYEAEAEHQKYLDKNK